MISKKFFKNEVKVFKGTSRKRHRSKTADPWFILKSVQLGSFQSPFCLPGSVYEAPSDPCPHRAPV